MLWRVRSAFEIELPVSALFEAPTVAELAERLDRLRQAGAITPLPAIQPAPEGSPLQLSFAQERLWFLDQLQPTSSFYNISGAFELRGPLDANALSRSLQGIVQRHQVLRTGFVARDGVPVPSLHDVSFHVPFEDLQSLSDVERDSRVSRLIQEEGRTPFRLDSPPLLRARLLRLAPERHLLLFTMHHIVGDGLSIDVLVYEFHLLYPAFAAGEFSPLPDLLLQYSDFSRWQRQWLARRFAPSSPQ